MAGPKDVNALQDELKGKSAGEVLRWAAGRFGARVALASSFGAEDVVLIDLAVKADPAFRIFTLDTGRLNEETYELIDRVRRRYGVTVVTYFPDPVRVERLVESKGFYSFRESVDNRKECCGIRKVEPLQRALEGLEAWVTGLRREQSPTRSGTVVVEWDAAHKGLWKINPLVDWTHDQVWDYIRANDVPYNRLHDLGYPSIGCEPCTRAVAPGEDVRAGRWWWEHPEHKECGLHRPGQEGRA